MAEEKFIKYPNDLFVTNTQQVSSGIAFSERIGKTGETYQKNLQKDHRCMVDIKMHMMRVYLFLKVIQLRKCPPQPQEGIQTKMPGQL